MSKKLSPFAEKLADFEKRRSASRKAMTAETVAAAVEGKASHATVRWTDADALDRPGWIVDFRAQADSDRVLLTSHAFPRHDAARAAAAQAGATQIETVRADGAPMRETE